MPIPILAHHASGAEIWDSDGRRYIDFGGGIAVLNIGHRDARAVPVDRRTCNGCSGTQVAINYDADGMPNCIQSDGIQTTFTPRDADERVTNQAFSVLANGSFYGNLTYTYDADG
ncbi:MAG TPA: aminotransferase class III-fold pyridoxal phosphate-dependent enzyme, partial [Candidatus Acidoferrum sp.]|nr:aminotransferase class III-fold pyridoxal phosphate-dependent enzyme [Candidatus Acidoferrum sp.]